MLFLDRLITLPQYLAPHHALSRLAWRIARSKNTAVKNTLIRTFLSNYDVDLSEAERPFIEDYESFNDFFTRKLRAGARPLGATDGAIVSPADGAISEIGCIDNGRLLQAKGRYYSLQALLGDDETLTRRFTGGSFATIYLAPRNYHRVHAPITGTVSSIRYIPGRLFSVNSRTARCVANLFARNERLIVEIHGAAGSIAVILVGAMLVASMELTSCDVPAAVRAASGAKRPFIIAPTKTPTLVERGAELGRFNMGSTVILLAKPASLSWDPALVQGCEVRVGQTIASVNSKAPSAAS